MPDVIPDAVPEMVKGTIMSKSLRVERVTLNVPVPALSGIDWLIIEKFTEGGRSSSAMVENKEPLRVFVYGLANGKEEVPFGTISGTASDASFRNSKISLYTLDSSDKRTFIASTTLDEAGSFSINIQALSQVLMLELSEGSYIESSSDILVNLSEGQVLTSPFFFEMGGDRS